MVGTVPYLAPEQRRNYIASNRNSHSAPINTFKGDVFSFGIMCYELITLKSPNGLNET